MLSMIQGNNYFLNWSFCRSIFVNSNLSKCVRSLFYYSYFHYCYCQMYNTVFVNYTVQCAVIVDPYTKHFILRIYVTGGQLVVTLWPLISFFYLCTVQSYTLLYVTEQQNAYSAAYCLYGKIFAWSLSTIVSR